MNVTFITGNEHKAKSLEKWLGFDIKHQKLDLDEIQSVDIRQVAEHKARQAYELLKSPVLIEDVGVEFSALGGLPGPYIKWFIEGPGLVATAKMLDGFADKSARALCMWAYFDGKNLEFIEGVQEGVIAPEPRGEGGWGWDKIFIPNDTNGRTRGELSDDEYEKSYTKSKNYPALRKMLLSK
jgi:inosine triphosphate pyrophosphatase